MREPLVAWAGDCLVRGSVDLEDGRLSDQLNERELVTFFDATLEALEDGHRVAMDEVEVGRGELHVIEVTGRRGDPGRRLRTVEEHVTLHVGPYTVTGNLHRPPSSPPLAALSRWARFVPVTDAVVQIADSGTKSEHQVVVLVNRARITASDELAPVPMGIDEPREPGTAIS